MMRSVTVSLFVMGLVLVGLAGMAHAETIIIPIENATFDTGLDGWEGNPIWSGTDNGDMSDGGFANVKGGSSSRTMRQWPLNETVMVGQGTYTLTFDASNQEWDATRDCDLVPMLQYYDGTTTGVLASDVIEMSGVVYPEWNTYTLIYVAEASDPHIGQQLGVAFTGGSLSRYSGVDNISLTFNPSPEPTTMGLLAVGALAILKRRHRS